MKDHLSRHAGTYLIVGVVAAGCVLVGLIGLFVRARLIAPAHNTPIPALVAQATPEVPACDQPALAPIKPTAVSPLAISITVATAGRSAGPLPFLELPFPYDGGNENFGGTDAQFKQASQRRVMGGRINSFFDHFYPLYPSPKAKAVTAGREPGELPIGDNVLIFDGTLNGVDYYSGHPAYDFTPFVPRQNTTPVFAAADGMVYDVGTHAASGALYVKIKHTVVGVGDFLTIYWHLNPDQYFDAMLSRKGQPISAGTRIGTMGNTGWSTGTHLHFEVRFDRNHDGVFTSDELVDPYGYTPSAAYPLDPWGMPEQFIDATGHEYVHTPSVSRYLWIHPLGATSEVPANGGGQIVQPAGLSGDSNRSSACAPAGSLPPGGTVNWSWSPDPWPSTTLAGVGDSGVLSAFDPQGRPAGLFDPPILIEIPFDPNRLQDIDLSTLSIYRAEPAGGDWVLLPTRLDMQRRIASAYTPRPGRFALLGKPLRDLVPPQTTIDVTGPTAPDGTWYDKVTVTLSSSDPSGIQQIEYSLDGGTTWQVYTAPLTLEPNGIPTPLPEDAEETFGGGPGRYLVLASSTDGAGNVEDPPAYRSIVIDPSKNPTPTPTRTRRPPTRTPTPTPTLTPTPTPMVTATIVFTATPLEVPAVGYCSTLTWDVEGVKSVWLDDEPVNGHGKRQVCLQETTTYILRVKLLDDTIAERRVTVSVAHSPDVIPPPAPQPVSPVGGAALNCYVPAVLTWNGVTDPSGIARYEWVLESSTSSDYGYAYFNRGATTGLSISTTVTCSQYYRWRVRAVDGTGNFSSYSVDGYFIATPPID